MTGGERYQLTSREISIGPGCQMKGKQLTLVADSVTVAEGAAMDLNAAGSVASGQGNSYHERKLLCGRWI